MTPSVRSIVNAAQAMTIAAAITARRASVVKRDPTSAPVATATAIDGNAYIGSSMPIMPLPIEGCTTRDVATNAMAISAMAPRRSRMGARLKNSHQTMIASAPDHPADDRDQRGIRHDHWQDHADDDKEQRGTDARPQPKRRAGIRSG